MSNIKAEIWPADVDLSFDFSKSTFGELIRSFKRFAMIEFNRDIIIEYLTKYNKKRNDVVHHLFEIENISALSVELDEYAIFAEEIFSTSASFLIAIFSLIYSLDT